MLTSVGQPDPIRRRMLADMGIDVWLLREPPVPSRAPPESRPAGFEATSDQVLAKSAAVNVVQSPTTAPEPANKPLAVTCLVSQTTLMLVDCVGPGVTMRLCRDLLASVAGQWRLDPREIAFTWPAGRSQSECWRAFKAFAEKQLSEQDVAVVMCSETLLERLPELGVKVQLLALPGLSELGADAKRAIWRGIQALSA
ncbi:MAG: hypothetical protein O7B25_08685 [Gammaproteobacteria bacterium]|nr:hypothetical protein [Gammaproteobacteria bacterium]